MIGATLGGGVGRYNGLHGMLLDSLLSVRMVTAAGNIITVSTTENIDLFWGIRGAGFNYGTILEATYSIYNETAPLVLNADFLFPLNATQTIFHYFKSLENDLPAKLSLVFLATYAPALGGVSPQICYYAY
jgi:FAD/FMN-containing dehydrogenase